MVVDLRTEGLNAVSECVSMTSASLNQGVAVDL